MMIKATAGLLVAAVLAGCGSGPTGQMIKLAHDVQASADRMVDAMNDRELASLQILNEHADRVTGVVEQVNAWRPGSDADGRRLLSNALAAHRRAAAAAYACWEFDTGVECDELGGAAADAARLTGRAVKALSG